jgi:hypothetical protein
MNKAEEIIVDIQRIIAPDDSTLEAARGRRDEVLSTTGGFEGALRTYGAGSIAHHTANDDTDADCGVVLDRRSYSELGPDGEGDPPNEIVEAVRSFIRDKLRQKHSNVAFRLTKRAIKITFDEPLSNGSDPSVDLIVALTREAGALWIPNLERKRWDASDPEYHTRLLMADPAGLRRMRAKVIRLAKAWNRQYSQPGLCSFNIEALSLESFKTEVNVVDGLAAFFKYAAADLAKRQTPDPAGVSAPIKTLVDRQLVADRLAGASEILKSVLNSDNENEIQELLASIYLAYVEPPAGGSSKAAFARALRDGNSTVKVTPGGLSIAATGGIPLKTTRAFGSATYEIR